MAIQPDPERKQIYHYSTGVGICPRCQSPNVRQFREKPGTAQRFFLWCIRLFRPNNWQESRSSLVVRRRAFECQSCSHRWS